MTKSARQYGLARAFLKGARAFKENRHSTAQAGDFELFLYFARQSRDLARFHRKAVSS